MAASAVVFTHIDPAHRMTHFKITTVCTECGDGHPVRCDRCQQYVRVTERARACDCTMKLWRFAEPRWWRPLPLQAALEFFGVSLEQGQTA